MDPNVNPDPTPHKPRDIAEAGPIDPATGQPDHGAETAELKSWFRENAVSLVITAGVIAAVCYWLDPIDTLKVVIGLGLVIFIHELGHFVAAKWCDVHVRTFSIGFGPAVPFCSYKYGETTYMIGIIPLGGYVAMVGENEEEEGEEDPRSFRRKSVGQRMVIISAGVVMNIILGMGCFVAAYLHGVQETPATVGYIEGGGAAWRAGMRTGDRVTNIDGREDPYFNDLKPIVMSSREHEQVPIVWGRGSDRFATTVSPLRDEGQRFPQLGISPLPQLTLLSGGKQKLPPVRPNTPAAAAETDGQKFEGGDRVVAMTDPADPAKLTPVESHTEYHRRMVLLAGKDVTVEVQRKDSDTRVAIVVKPTFRYDLGVRMRMYEVAAVRAGGTAEGKVVAHAEGAQAVRGDRITAVMLPPDATGKRTWYVAGSVLWDKSAFQVPGIDAKNFQERVNLQPLDPLLLPLQLSRWAQDKTGKVPVELVVLRAAHPTDDIVRIALDYDTSYRFDNEAALQPNSPLPVSGLGLAYWVEAVVDDVAPGGPAAEAKTAPGELPTGVVSRVKRFFGVEGRDVPPGGDPKPLQRGDQIVAVRFKARDAAGKVTVGEWKDDMKSHQWASADAAYQYSPPEIDLRVTRANETIEVTVVGRPATEWPTDDRGLLFQSESQVQKAADVGDAIRLGALRTVRFIKTVYMNLYAMVIGRVSAKTMSGPLTIANVSYKLAGEDFWQFLLFLGMISVNLAVVNFLPIPVLDGGHMVFLIYEKVSGRPVPERLFAFFMYTGLFLILSLMVFVLFLDVKRLFFGWF